MSEVSIRVYRAGDEERIPSLLRRCFDTFNRYGLDREKWLEYARLNEGFKLEGAYVLEVKGTLVSHVQVVEKTLRTAAGVLLTAGIANVSTDPQYRGRGYATKLLRSVIEEYKGIKFPLTALFTGFASGPQRIYRRLGYVDVCLEETLTAPLSDAERAALKVSGIEVREAEDRDLPALMQLYEEAGRHFTGWPRRPENDWREKIFARTAYHSFFYVPREEGNLVVAEEGGEVLGYAITIRSPQEPEFMWLLELIYRQDRPDALQSLYTYAVERAARLGLKAVRASIPLENAYKRVFREFRPQASGGVYMAEVLDLEALVREALRAVDIRASNLVTRTRVEIRYRDKAVKLRLGGGEAALHDGDVEAIIDVNPEVFNRLLFGFSNVEELLLSSHVKSDVSLRQVAEALNTLFSPRPLHIWPIDHW
ncbi:MAG: hypothetical protein DRK00_02480 [Thermoprotei archaeon]|nr:MAG: hypothetical protein DRK00_02480 [Thermoprotei archaeon]